MTKAGNTLTVATGMRVILMLLASMCVLVIGWTAAAQARTSTAGQYGSPTDSGVAAISAASKGSGGAALTSGGAALTSVDGGAGSAGVLPLTGLLPETGGPLLSLALLGALSLGCGGVLSLRCLRSLKL